MDRFLISDPVKNRLIFISIGLTVTLAIVVIGKILSRKRVSYVKKSCLLTAIEQQYYSEFKSILGEQFLIFPQINLASVIDKQSAGYRTELFRNVDFGIFDYDFRPLLLIEINDASHTKSNRIERDKTVNEICKKAKLPLITFWTKDGINRKYFIQIFNKYLY